MWNILEHLNMCSHVPLPKQHSTCSFAICCMTHVVFPVWFCSFQGHRTAQVALVCEEFAALLLTWGTILKRCVAGERSWKWTSGGKENKTKRTTQIEENAKPFWVSKEFKNSSRKKNQRRPHSSKQTSFQKNTIPNDPQCISVSIWCLYDDERSIVPEAFGHNFVRIATGHGHWIQNPNFPHKRSFQKH